LIFIGASVNFVMTQIKNDGNEEIFSIARGSGGHDKHCGGLHFGNRVVQGDSPRFNPYVEESRHGQ
jgi:hypothetical protein